ncbi:hypothetical protein P872_14335 [Rhodonellum psychrophilum GCM71 = DSM 17998]|uniref:Arm DNA-binding domain-containing protein n=2 Tax=Rhodonellum TaxID=336827 RepID=U5BIE5_9BACT|nr:MULTISPECIES: Arm DNA-binding domain-containing protein [Rhodonellum]ERM80185.1 hypothetical protein P872_14335 [Rhodonellum psychrophilum GCM71 = DSM 17998]SDZ59479.1 Phage integrase SAM-like domain-containing protein [Rhodonellum ikkaensis]
MKAKKQIAKLYAYKKNTTKEGLTGLYIAVSFNRKTKYLPLKIYWPASHFDFEKQQIIKRSGRDKEYSDNMLIITQAIGICNEIFVQYRLRDQEISMETFLEEYYQFNLKKDYITYMESIIEKRYRKKDISETTKKNHTNTLKKIKSFHPKLLPFSAVNVKVAAIF